MPRSARGRCRKPPDTATRAPRSSMIVAGTIRKRRRRSSRHTDKSGVSQTVRYCRAAGHGGRTASLAVGTERGDAVTIQCGIVYWPAFFSYAVAKCTIEAEKAIVKTPVPHVLCGRVLMQGYTVFVKVGVVVTLDFQIPKHLVALFIRSCQHRHCCSRSLLGDARRAGDR